MSDLVVRTRLPVSEVKRRFAEIPYVLMGRKNDPKGLRRYFFAVLARLLFQRISAAYDIKAKGGTDSLGVTWRSLAPATIKRRLSPKYLNKFPLSAKLWIMRLSDRLFQSLEAGFLSPGGFYYPPNADQLFEIRGAGLSLGTRVPYANAQHVARPLWPEKMQPWLDECADIAISYVMEQVARDMSKDK
jgi:hypothetical protein